MLKLCSILIVTCFHTDNIFSLETEVNLPEKILYELNNIDDLFKEFIEKYDKKYNATEMGYRRKVFREKLEKINQWNREQPNSIFGIGPFSDIPYEEFIKTYTGFFGNFTNENVVQYKPQGMAPDSLDWRQSNIVTRVKDQKTCGSCYVFSTIGNIESLHAKKHGELIELSEQQGLDCNPKGCDGGLPEEVAQILAKEGCIKESDYPYESVKKQCRADPSKAVVKVLGSEMLNVSSEEDLKDAVANIGPLVVAITVEPRLLHHHGKVFIPQECQNSEDHHAVLLVGYGSDNGTPYWIMKNSWGTTWNPSEGGYFRMIRGQWACHLGEYIMTTKVD